MKSFFSVILAVIILPTLALAQGPSFDVRFNIQEINCEQSFVLVDLELKASEGSAAFNIAHHNLRFTYNTNALANPSIEEELAFSGFNQTSNPTTYSFFGAHTLAGSTANLVSYNVFLALGTGYPVTDTEWISVGRLRFDIIDIDECFDFLFSAQAFALSLNGATSVLGKENGLLYAVPEGNYTNDNTCPVNDCTPVQDPAQFDLQFSQTTVDCQNMKFLVDLEIKASTMNSGFNAAFMNLRFTFNQNALGNPVLNQELNFSDLVNENGAFSFYNPHTLNGSLGDLVSYNVSLGGGVGQSVDDNWIAVGRVEFDILDINQCADLQWNDLADFPSTIVIEKTIDGLLLQTLEGTYNSADPCLFEACPPGFNNEDIYDVVLKPVPVYHDLGIEFTTNQPGTIQVGVVSNNGRIVKQKSITAHAGVNTFSLDLKDQPAGVYSITFMSGKSVSSKQFIKLNAYEAANLR